MKSNRASVSATLVLLAMDADYVRPIVLSIDPVLGAAAGATALTITGSRFADYFPGTTTVTVGGVAATVIVVVNDTTITAVTPAGSPATDQDVVVGNDNSTGTLSAGFHYNGVAPELTSLDVDEGDVAGGTAVTITGLYFALAGAGTTTVTFDAEDATDIVVVDATTVTCVTPAGGGAGAVDVVLTNDYGSDTLTDGFTYTSP